VTAHRSRYVLTSLLATSLLITACTAGRHPSTATAARPGGQALLTIATPAAKTQLDTVTWNVWEGEPQTIDPFLSADYTPNTINSNMCETLLALYPDYTIRPNLASSFSNPDPLHWVYNLRTDVKFWDGTPMTAQDVAWSMNHNLTDAASFYNYLYSRVKSITVTGPAQVTVALKQPDYLFNDELTDYAGVIVEQKFAQAHPKDFGAPNVGFMCTGPFKFQSWTKGDNITVVRNDSYWDPARMPKVKTLIFKFLTDEAAITAALQTGEIDGAYDPPLSGQASLQASNAGKLYFGPSQSNVTFVYANPAGPMRNLKLRQALQMAVDWAGINHTILNGTGTLIKALMPPTVFGADKATLQSAYDALPAPQSAQYAAAKALVAQAGPDAHKPIVMAVPALLTGQGRLFGEAIAAAATQIGLNFKLKIVPTDQYTNYLYDPKTRAGVDILSTDFWPNVPNALDWLGIAATSGGSFNQYGYSQINATYAQAQGTADPVKRGELEAQMMTQVSTQLLPMVPGISRSSRLWMNNRITGVSPAFDYVYFPWAAYLGGSK
jgi:peptide/nickel transport system substrate-binding protein